MNKKLIVIVAILALILLALLISWYFHRQSLIEDWPMNIGGKK